LRQYAREFGSVEVDSTFYGTPPPERLVRWARSVPATFTFALKLPREITHERRLIGGPPPIAAFFESALVLGPQLEAVLVQLPPDFGPEEWDALAAFVAGLPSGPRIALEVRDPRWFAVDRRAELLALLRDRGIALAVSDGIFVHSLVRPARQRDAFRPRGDRSQRAYRALGGGAGSGEHSARAGLRLREQSVYGPRPGNGSRGVPRTWNRSRTAHASCADGTFPRVPELEGH
jgi:uncharacterized protein YecE (DUF72 family)